ncbi:MAG: sigma-54 dependent transcriptional regulator [Desulfobacterales bacterium]|nr:sigma-54 dependent transcriptional regulator [Desulfobacteraceae bacterium]MDY0312346.1 sigma-54 dependent transcriptional regulator [Desulfobacterales bacterium]
MATTPSPQEEGTATARIVCLDRSTGLFRQAQELFRNDKSVVVVYEKSMEKVLELAENEVCDVLLATSAIVRDGRSAWKEFIEVFGAKSPWTRVIFFISPRELALASKALKAGSYHYAKLPVGDEELRLLIEAALDCRSRVDTQVRSGPSLRAMRFEEMVGVSAGMKNVYRMIRQAAATDILVLLTGETGTGKDLAARAIHQLSDRSEKAFFPVHLGALPKELVPGELFGHVKGAFTGAAKARAGSLELADGGTVFLDEISTIDDRVQISLLRLLENKSFCRIGGRRAIKADVRIIAATNEDLHEAVEAGRFREDLYYRLEVFRIHMPPLRERIGDIPLLVQDFLMRYNQIYDKRITGLAPEAMAMLEAYDWPGNVRELKNVIHRAVVVCMGDIVNPEHLSARIKPGRGDKGQVVLKVGASFEEAEVALLRKTLQATGNNRRHAAALLGVSRSTLYNKIKKYRL